MIISELVARIFDIYWLLLLARIILSWIPMPSNPILNQVSQFIHDITEPYLNIFRRLLPMARLGGMGIDFSPIIGFIVLSLLREVVVGALVQAGL